jgi:hypothetical protein
MRFSHVPLRELVGRGAVGQFEQQRGADVVGAVGRPALAGFDPRWPVLNFVVALIWIVTNITDLGRVGCYSHWMDATSRWALTVGVIIPIAIVFWVLLTL